MAFDENLKVWMDGELVALKDAKISVLSHVVHYGTAVFEGIRCYETENGPAVFRLQDHVQRLFDSAKIYKMDIPFTQEEICDAIIETIKENNLKGCYIRPITFRGFGELGVNPLNCPVNTTIAVSRCKHRYFHLEKTGTRYLTSSCKSCSKLHELPTC